MIWILRYIFFKLFEFNRVLSIIFIVIYRFLKEKRRFILKSFLFNLIYIFYFFVG